MNHLIREQSKRELSLFSPQTTQFDTENQVSTAKTERNRIATV